MSTKIKNIQKDIFGRITKNEIIDRCQIHLSENEFDILSSAKRITTLSYGEYGFVLLKTNEGVFIGITSSQECDLDGTDLNNDFDCCEVTAPYWMAIVDFGKLNVRKETTDSQIKDLIDIDSLDTILEYSFEQLVPLFNDVALLKYNDELSEEIDPYLFLKKVAMLVFLEHKQARHLGFEVTTISIYKRYYNTIDLKHRAFPLDNIIRSLVSSEWRFCYLDLYRCIERLYPIKQFSETLDLLEKGSTHEELLDQFVLSRAREINHLIEICETVFLKNKNIFDPILNEDSFESEKKPSKAANKIYSIRNMIAHDQITDYQFKNDEEANIFIRILLEIINESYTDYQEYLKKIFPVGINANEKYRITHCNPDRRECQDALEVVT